MKKYLIPLLLIVVQVLNAQDIDEVKKYAYLGQHAKAKDAVDKYLAVEKNARKPEGWFYKGYTYNMVSKDSSLSLEQSAALKLEAFNALKKYREMDPKAELLTEQNNSPFYDMYAGYAQDLGIRAYNNKDFAAAGKYFEDALAVHSYVSTNNLAGAGGYRFPAVDTTLTLYAGVAYNQAKDQESVILKSKKAEIEKNDKLNPEQKDLQIKELEKKSEERKIMLNSKGMAFFQKLSDAGIGGEQYLDVYQQLADYYRNKKDNSAFATAIDRGRKLYPQNDDYWVALEIENAVDGVEKPAVFERYESLLKKYPENFAINYNYAVELYQYVYSDERKTADNEAYKTKITSLLDRALKTKPESLEANFLMANFTYNNSIDISEAAMKIKGPKPEDLKRKKEMNERSMKMMDSAIPYAEKVVNIFGGIAKPKSSEKINYRQSVVILRNIYESKKDAANADKYDKLLKTIQ